MRPVAISLALHGLVLGGIVVALVTRDAGVGARVPAAPSAVVSVSEPIGDLPPLEEAEDDLDVQPDLLLTPPPEPVLEQAQEESDDDLPLE
ncbi:MAG: hypothetical protein KDB73_16695, partial [Planctomycetes bacterium]|nr:hypothetical protein [Planctomycetota bacterium]